MMDFPNAPVDTQAYVANAQTRWTWKTADNAWIGGVGFQIVDDEAPVDGESYVRVAPGSGLFPGITGETGAWAPSFDRTILTPVGVNTVEYVVPATARMLRITGHCYLTAGTNYVFAHLSTDGTNYLTGASDYQQAGAVMYAGTSTWSTGAMVNTANMLLHVSGDYNQFMPSQFEALLMVERPSTAKRLMCHSTGVSYYNNALYYDAIQYYRCSLLNASGLRAQKIRFNTYAGTFLAGSFIEIEELA